MVQVPEFGYVEYEPEGEFDDIEFTDEVEEVEEDETPPTASPATLIAEMLAFVDSLFDPDGLLSQAAVGTGRNYEYRVQQKIMSQRVAKSLAECHNLCVEAPTGVGKSFAYLVAVLKFSQFQKQPVIITTETINLQEQLIDKDLPLLKKVTGLDFIACLAKGRSNYLCRRRLSMLTDSRREQLLPAKSMFLEVEHIAKWAEKTTDGDPDGGDVVVDPSVWSLVCCESGNCLGARCSYFRNCFYYKARLQWEKSNIIVANHALFLTDLKLRQADDLSSSLLPSYSAVVIDEAHTLENNAADHLGFVVNQAAMLGWLNRLFSESGRGLLMHKGEAELELRGLVTQIRGEVRTFFRIFAEFIKGGNDGTVRRCTQPNVFPNILDTPLSKLRKGLRNLIDVMQDDDDQKSYTAELESQLSRCDGYINAINDFLTMSVPEAVYWAEESREIVQLQVAPLNVAELLKNLLFLRPISVILTSATLTVDNSFQYYVDRVGFEGGEMLQLDSPYSVDQVKMVLPSFMPEPADPEYRHVLPDKVVQAVRLTGGKAFVLFTSYQQMRECAESLRNFFSDEEILMLVQGDEMRRSAMLRKFKEDINSVLFGVDSFWTGVDVPGEALSNVIVTKLPFGVPSHPLIKARCERIEQNGGNSFMHYSLPEAVLKFRQGVGRLIRSQSDSGYIVILDRRVISKRYGKIFLNSLPRYQIIYL